jgi:magnesium chelatase family protein
MGFSARAFNKVVRVARTIADLEGSTNVEAFHLSEAIHTRMTDRELMV